MRGRRPRLSTRKAFSKIPGFQACLLMYYKGRGAVVVLKQRRNKALVRLLEDCDLWRRGETINVRLGLLEKRRRENEQLSVDLPSGKR